MALYDKNEICANTRSKTRRSKPCSYHTVITSVKVLCDMKMSLMFVVVVKIPSQGNRFSSFYKFATSLSNSVFLVVKIRMLTAEWTGLSRTKLVVAKRAVCCARMVFPTISEKSSLLVGKSLDFLEIYYSCFLQILYRRSNFWENLGGKRYFLCSISILVKRYRNTRKIGFTFLKLTNS